jgi:hypothetical protein
MKDQDAPKKEDGACNSPEAPESCAPPAAPAEPGSDPGKDRAHPLERLGSLGLALGFAGVTAIALHVHPDPSGIGTHTQFGLPPCGLYDRIGIPCLSCGWTTAFAHMARLEVVRAFLASPFGALLYAAGFAAALGNLAAAILGRSFFRFLARIDWTWVGIAAVILVLASWGYKILTAGRLFN